MRLHRVEGVAAGPLAQVGVEGDVAAEERLDGGAEIPDDRARAHDNAAHDAEIAHDALARQLESGGDEQDIDSHGEDLLCGRPDCTDRANDELTGGRALPFPRRLCISPHSCAPAATADENGHAQPSSEARTTY